MISTYFAANTLLFTFALLFIFHLLLLFGVVPYGIVWAGKIKDHRQFNGKKSY